MLKGFFGYESAFRAYTREMVRVMADDGVSYAELRPNFPSNVLMKDDASGTYTNIEMCQMIIDEVNAAKAVLPDSVHFEDVKIIYCAPKLPAPGMTDMRANLRECLDLKKRFENLIWGTYLPSSPRGLLINIS